MRLLSYNIRFGGAGRESHLAETIQRADPDVVVLQEATRPTVVARVAEMTGMKRWAASPGHSVGFMSRMDVTHHEWHRPSRRGRSFLEIVLAPGGVRIYGLHLSATHSNWMERRRVGELKGTLQIIATRPGSHLVVGDFNTLAPGERLDIGRLPRGLQLLAWMSGKTIRWQTVQIMLDAGYVDGYRALHPDPDGATFPTRDPHIRLDYAFVPKDDAPRLRRCDVVRESPAASASDHFPLLVEFEP